MSLQNAQIALQFSALGVALASSALAGIQQSKVVLGLMIASAVIVGFLVLASYTCADKHEDEEKNMLLVRNIMEAVVAFLTFGAAVAAAKQQEWGNTVLAAVVSVKMMVALALVSMSRKWC